MNYSNLINYLRGSRCTPVVVDVAANSTVAVAVPCELLSIYVNTVLSAHACPINDDVTNVVTLPASLAAGTHIVFPAPVLFATNLSVDPNDAATGNLSLFYRVI